MPIFVIFFQIIIILLVPILSMNQLKMVEELKELVLTQRKKLYIQSAFNQIILAVMAVWALSALKMDVAYWGNFNVTAFLIGCSVLAFVFTINWFSKEDIKANNPGLDLLIPKTKSEKFTWVFVNIIASFCEEVIYRIVLYYLFLYTTNNPILAACFSALVFGASHSVQGIYGIIVSFLFALCLQYIAYQSNGIIVATIIHFIHNMGSTILVLIKTRNIKEEEKEY